MSFRTAFQTGASGFIGSHLAAALTSQGVHVSCLVRSLSRAGHLQSEEIDLVRGDLTDPDSCHRAVGRADLVINATGLTHSVTHSRLLQVNAKAVEPLADVCASQEKPPRLIHISSLAAAGPLPESKKVRDETDPLVPISAYGYSKLQGEFELRNRAARLPITIVRPGVVYGPRDPGILTIARPICQCVIHPVVGFRTPALSLIYVEDLVKLLIRAIACGETLRCNSIDEFASQGTYVACDDSEFPSYRELGVRLGKEFDRRVFVLPLIKPVAYGVAGIAQTVNRIRGRSSFLNIDKVREARFRSWACRATKARRHLGRSPKKTRSATQGNRRLADS